VSKKKKDNESRYDNLAVGNCITNNLSAHFATDLELGKSKKAKAIP
jgi:hypothetical protein